jgi:hypothetical protein
VFFAHVVNLVRGIFSVRGSVPLPLFLALGGQLILSLETPESSRREVHIAKNGSILLIALLLVVSILAIVSRAGGSATLGLGFVVILAGSGVRG